MLIVDDDASLLETLAEIVRLQGHRVRVARDGEEGLRALAEGAPDVVILDVEMPALDGPGMALRMFLRDAGLERIPILLLSGYFRLAEVAERIGTPYSLPKPCALDDLLALLRRVLDERRGPTPQIAPRG